MEGFLYASDLEKNMQIFLNQITRKKTVDLFQYSIREISEIVHSVCNKMHLPVQDKLSNSAVRVSTRKGN